MRDIVAGIMQLAMLAPYSNLASSVAAALVPTLLAPRFNQSDGAGESPDRKGEAAGIERNGDIILAASLAKLRAPHAR